MSKDESSETLVKRHVGYSMLAGAIPIPLVDIAAVTAIQLDLIKELARLYEVDYIQERGKALITALINTAVGSMIGRAGASAVKVIPGIGTLLGIGSQAILAGASTYAIGQVFDYHFRNGGSLFDFDVDAMKEAFKDFFQKGKKVAQEMKDQPDKDDILETIKKLKELKDAGTITEDEFEKTKKDLLEKLGQ